ncbi:hypothetical protein EPN52_03735 [bacterium]|nr:MAG: hypothetical protein EPN52_03735 [bacterium]
MSLPVRRLALALVIVCGCYLAAAFAVTDAAALVLLRDAAAPVSLPRLLPAAWALPLAQTANRLLPTPWSAEAAARAALARGDDTAAERWIARMPPGRYATAMRAALAESRGNAEAAADGDLRDGDARALARIVDELSTRDLPRALRLQRHLVAALDADPSRPPSRGEAYWRLGMLEARSGHGDAAARAYARAVELAPYAGLYALSYAQHLWYEEHDAVLAERYFRRTLEDDPAAAPAYVGLAQIAAARGDQATARADLARARAIDPRVYVPMVPGAT